MKKITQFVIKWRYIVLIFFGLALIGCCFTINKVKTQEDITAYLSKDTDTKKAVEIMKKEFVTYGSTSIYIENINSEEAFNLQIEMRVINGVKEVAFDSTDENYYKDNKALINVTFIGDENNKEAYDAYYDILNLVDDYDYYIKAPLVDTFATELLQEVIKIMILAVIIIILIFCLTLRSFAEIFIFLVVFAVSALLNMGTHYWFGTISFISKTVCLILQLALAIDYAIILSHRFSEEKEKHDNTVDAMSSALERAVPEIFGSSLTTIAGLLALTCMTFRLGADLGLVLAKSIGCSILTVFLLMPLLLILFNKPITKTTHRIFLPKINKLGSYIIKARFVLLPICLVLFVICGILSFKVSYVYSDKSIDVSRKTEEMKAIDLINKNFGIKNQFVILVPNDQTFTNEKTVTTILKNESLINSITCLSEIEIKEGLFLSTKLDYQEFASVLSLDELLTASLYQKIAEKTNISDLSNFKLSIFDISKANIDIKKLYDDNLITNTQYITFVALFNQLNEASLQLYGNNYTRIIINIDSPTESKETFEVIERLNKEVKGACKGCIFAGDSMNCYDLNESFTTDIILTSLITILFVCIVLFFTTKSFGAPLLLVLTIQGAIFINFSCPVVMGSNVFFFVYLIVSAIQMGATIDYAIVMSSRYFELRETLDKKEAIKEALNHSFSTIITSGGILTITGFLVSLMVSNPIISTLGFALGRGTIVSILCVMVFLPCLLYCGDKIINKTSVKKFIKKKDH